ncbi:MAG: H-NS histone family protein [Alphaproteobacteria bacterium]|nr:H-NS histone family protein [Alphaproteobacteria bacterium]MDI9329890.1 H-NS histone family protein [Alphaproteobacteria bacterium]
MPRITVANQLEKIRAARAKLEREEKKLLSRTYDKALNQIVQIARNAGLSAEQITAALGGKTRTKTTKGAAKSPKKTGSTAGRKVAPKYRDPANPDNTWTGRGRMPQWVAALQAKGELANAEIKA